MKPPAGRRPRASGDLGTDGAGRQQRGASLERGRRSRRSAGAGGSEVVSACRGPPHGCPRRRERPGSRPGLSEHRRLPAPHKISTGSLAGGRTETRPAISAVRCVLAEVIASPALAVLAMTFSHSDLGTPVTPPWRDHSCPCKSERETKRSSGDGRAHFVPLRGRHGDDARPTSGRVPR
jgi:hypothetical protein